MTKITQEQLEEIVENLQGTCNDLDSIVDEVTNCVCSGLDLTFDQHDYINQQIFLCETCGWWYEICEQSEDFENCESCFESSQEE